MDIGARIAEARAALGLNQTQLASAVGLDRATVSKIETGARRVSALELVAFARELRRRIDWFVHPGPEAIVSYRAANPGIAQQSMDLELERIARDVEFVAELVPHLIDGQPEPFAQPRSPSEADALADQARRLLDLNPDQPAHNLIELVAKIGLLVFARPLGDGADGGTVLLRVGGVSVVNSDRQRGRRRLTLAHELGHYLVADPYTTDWHVAATDGDVLEARLDRFARALLLPERDLRRRWISWRAVQDETVRDAAVRATSHYQVDMSTLARRLTELQLIDGATADVVRGARTKRADIVEKDLVVPPEPDKTILPRPYQRAVLELYRSEDISAERALELLIDTFDEDALPDLPPVPRSEIWNLIS